ncbi:MAG TPA: hypothetical protein VF632_24600 [Longimicrobium sp.]
MSAVCLAVSLLLLLALIGALPGSRRSGGGQRKVRNAPALKVQDKIPGPPPRGRKP